MKLPKKTGEKKRTGNKYDYAIYKRNSLPLLIYNKYCLTLSNPLFINAHNILEL